MSRKQKYCSSYKLFTKIMFYLLPYPLIHYIFSCLDTNSRRSLSSCCRLLRPLTKFQNTINISEIPNNAEISEVIKQAPHSYQILLSINEQLNLEKLQSSSLSERVTNLRLKQARAEIISFLPTTLQYLSIDKVVFSVNMNAPNEFYNLQIKVRSLSSYSNC